MKKIAYQTPEVKVKALLMEDLLKVSGEIDGNPEIGWGGTGDGMEGDAKEDGLKSHSVWDD